MNTQAVLRLMSWRGRSPESLFLGISDQPGAEMDVAVRGESAPGLRRLGHRELQFATCLKSCQHETM